MKIRIAVAVNADGFWIAAGAADKTDAESKKVVCDFASSGDDLSFPWAITWIEAEVALPAETVIRAGG